MYRDLSLPFWSLKILMILKFEPKIEPKIAYGYFLNYDELEWNHSNPFFKEQLK